LYTAHQVKLTHISKHYSTPNIVVIPSILVNKLQIESMYVDAMSRDCEGIIIRNPTGIYKYNERSSDVFKYKKSLDCEKQVIGYNLDKNGHPVFIVAVGDGTSNSFKVKLKGTDAERLEIAANASSYLGKWLNLSYEVLSRDGKCLKPVGNYFRVVSAEGEPLE